MLHLRKTMFGWAKVFNTKGQDGTKVRVLKVGGAYQSATYLDERRFQPVFEYYRAFDHMFDSGHRPSRVLMIGGGGCAYPKHLLTTHLDVFMDVVEIDPAIVKISKKWFFVDELLERCGAAGDGRLRIFAEDGITYVHECGDASYDVVINDSFEGMAPTVGLLATGNLLEAKRALVPGGLYLLNAVIGDGERHVLTTFMELLLEAFDNVWAIPCVDENFSGEDNYLLAASDEQCVFDGVELQMSR